MREPDGAGRDAEAAGIKGRERDSEAAALGAHQSVGIDAHVVENHLSGRRRRCAHLALGWCGGESGCGSVDEQAADAARTIVARTHHDRVEVGTPTVRDPGLGAVDRVGITVTDRCRGQGGRIGSGVRLGEAVAADQLATDHVGEPAIALRIGTEHCEGEAGQVVHADAHADAHPRARYLFEHLEGDLVGLLGAAVLRVER